MFFQILPAAPCKVVWEWFIYFRAPHRSAVLCLHSPNCCNAPSVAPFWSVFLWGGNIPKIATILKWTLPKKSLDAVEVVLNLVENITLKYEKECRLFVFMRWLKTFKTQSDQTNNHPANGGDRYNIFHGNAKYSMIFHGIHCICSACRKWAADVPKLTRPPGPPRSLTQGRTCFVTMYWRTVFTNHQAHNSMQYHTIPKNTRQFDEAYWYLTTYGRHFSNPF